jgi:SAM-dependent methyltransferase
VESAELRGGLVAKILRRHRSLEGATVIDMGCGIGGSSAALHDAGARVLPLDVQLDRLSKAARRRTGLHPLAADAARLPFPDASADVVVMQDMLEHVPDPAGVLREAERVLRPGGLLYLSTPNRQSPLNLLADPHFGLPLVALLRRRGLRRVLRVLRPADAGRADLAQLLSHRELLAMLPPGLSLRTHETPTVLRVLFETPRAVIWSGLHLRLVSLLRRSGGAWLLERYASHEAGFVNCRLLPTWYLLIGKDM